MAAALVGWFFASRAAHVEIDFDIELARKQSAENPVYYVQYAHARIASILRKAVDAGLAPAGTGASGGGGAASGASAPVGSGARSGDMAPEALAGAPEAALVRALARFPEVVEDAAYYLRGFEED